MIDYNTLFMGESSQRPFELKEEEKELHRKKLRERERGGEKEGKEREKEGKGTHAQQRCCGSFWAPPVVASQNRA